MITPVYTPGVPTVPKTGLLIALIAAQGWDDAQELGYPLKPGPEIVDTPDRAVFLTPAGGPGYVTEEASHDAWAFQARLRGPSDNPLEPELKMQQLDQLILTVACPAQIRGVTVSSVGRLGSPPVPLPLDPSSRRFEYTCTYLIVTGGG